jgi:hypothetical protein
MRLESLLRAHEFMKIERPPELWEADTEDVRLIPLLGEMIASGLAVGASLGELTLGASNVVVSTFEDDDAGAQSIQVPNPGEYVALTVSGPTDFGADGAWYPGTGSSQRLLARLTGRLDVAGVRFAYIRQLPSSGSFTVFLRRKVPASHA